MASCEGILDILKGLFGFIDVMTVHVDPPILIQSLLLQPVNIYPWLGTVLRLWISHILGT
jgi:hypothetical protein